MMMYVKVLDSRGVMWKFKASVYKNAAPKPSKKEASASTL